MHGAAVIVVTALFAACVAGADRDAFRRGETALEAARELARVTCASPAACAATWDRARRFVQSASATPVSLGDDDDAAETDDAADAPPLHALGSAYFWVVRETAADGATTIHLKGVCRGMYAGAGGPGWTYGACATQIGSAELAFARVVGELH